VDGQPAKPYRVGAAVEPGLVLQALGPRRAELGPAMGAPATLTLDMPFKK
jgi:general secretion pathway protein C